MCCIKEFRLLSNLLRPIAIRCFLPNEKLKSTQIPIRFFLDGKLVSEFRGLNHDEDRKPKNFS